MHTRRKLVNLNGIISKHKGKDHFEKLLSSNHASCTSMYKCARYNLWTLQIDYLNFTPPAHNNSGWGSSAQKREESAAILKWSKSPINSGLLCNQEERASAHVERPQ
jgi:hypothetical protein